jgi:hypothetical protein
MSMHKLNDPFDTDQAEHFTHYDYLLQVIENGQGSALRDHIKVITNKSLIRFYEIMPNFPAYRKIVQDEILKRMT